LIICPSKDKLIPLLFGLIAFALIFISPPVIGKITLLSAPLISNLIIGAALLTVNMTVELAIVKFWVAPAVQA